MKKQYRIVEFVDKTGNRHFALQRKVNFIWRYERNYAKDIITYDYFHSAKKNLEYMKIYDKNKEEFVNEYYSFGKYRIVKRLDGQVLFVNQKRKWLFFWKDVNSEYDVTTSVTFITATAKLRRYVKETEKPKNGKKYHYI